MGALDKWLPSSDPWDSNPAIPAIPAIPANHPNEAKDLAVADTLLPAATRNDENDEIAGGSNQPATLQAAENRAFQGQIAGIAEIAGAETPLGKVVAKSRLPPASLNAEGWRDFFEERAAILEHEGRLSREQSERLAYEAAVAGVTNAMPADYPQDTCAACGTHLGPQQGLPLADTAVVCNSACHTQHRQQQRERAERQLAEWEIGLPTDAA